MGSTFGLLEPIIPYFETGYDLLCFKNNFDPMYIEDSSYCSVITDINSTFEKPKIQVDLFPNPITDISTIKINNSNNEEFTLQIFNLAGIKIKEIINVNSNIIMLSTKDFSNGFYLFRLFNNKNIPVFNGIFITQ